MRVLVVEPSAPIANALRKFLDGVADVQVAHFLDEAVQLVRARPPDVIIASASASFEGEVLCAQVKKLVPVTRVVLAYPPADFERAPARAKAAGADGFMVGPLKRHMVLGQLHAVGKQRELLEQRLALESALAQAKAVAKAPRLRPATGLNTADHAFFKKYLLLEVKRSKRYQYPVALLLVAVDRLEERLAAEASSVEFQRAAIRAEVLQGLSHVSRDIDLLMPFANDKYLVFLPHTSRGGCVTVSKRVVQQLRQLASLPNSTGSVGVASYDPKVDGKSASVSFGGLVRQATMALKRAQSAGGDRAELPDGTVMPKKSRISMG